jgi:hypothetical protein
MGFRIDVREVGPNDKVPKTGWPTGQPAAAAPPEPQPAFVQMMTDIGGKLMHWAKGGTPPVRPASPADPAVERTTLDISEVMEPSRSLRAAPPARDENDSPEAMIKPSKCHRVAIEAHRDDWP